ncbi:MAG: crotonase/enoyl-CoA hydratase family protein [Halieaceae bacterium]
MMNYEQQGDVALLHFDDGKVNSVGTDFIANMNAGLDRAEAEARAVLILGREGKFSAGFDLSEFKKGPEATRELVTAGARMMLRLFTHPQPLVAACSGHAIAAGGFMLLCADTRVGIEGEFKLGLNETAIGMVIPPFGIELATARLSKRHLQAATVQGQLFDPQQAQDVGFLDAVVTADQLREHCLALAAQLAQLPGEAYAGNKRAMRRPYIERMEASLSGD